MIKPRDFLCQANELMMKDELSEVDVRSAVSRAYYSLFHETFEFLKLNHKELLIQVIVAYLESKKKTVRRDLIEKFDENYINSNMSTHTTVIKAIREIKGDLADECADDFLEFKNWRTVADYRLNQDLDSQREKERIEAIRILIERIKKL